MATVTQTLRAGRRTVRLGRPDKELFGPGGVTKRELAGYYRSAAPAMLRHIRDRPLALQRFPEGIDAADRGFFMKNRPEHAPAWVESHPVPRQRGGAAQMIVCDDTATLLWLVDQAVITVHTWLSRIANPRFPDRIVIDLDPADDDFARVREAAYDVREVMGALGLACGVMATGSRGLHVVAPIRPEIDAEDARRFARIIAELTARRRPRHLTTRVRKDQRGGRLFVDYLRNGYAQHSVAPYAVRALPGAPVAVPLSWDELDGLASPQRWTVRDLGERLRHDPWHDMARHARSPLKAIDRLD